MRPVNNDLNWSLEKRRFFMWFYLRFANSSTCITVALKSYFLVVTKVKWRKSSGITNLKTRLLSSVTSNNNPLAPGPRDILCPVMIYCFVLQGTKALRSKYNLWLAGWATGRESLPHLKAPFSNSLKFASQLTEELRSDFFKLWAWYKEMFHSDVFIPVAVVAFWTAFSLLPTNWSLVGLAVWLCTERKTSFVRWSFCQKRDTTLSSKWPVN